MRILGLSAFYHDSAAALIVDGKIIAAAQEERFTRRKHDASFPINAVKSCLSYESQSLAEVDFVAFYDKPFLKFERLMETYAAFAPSGFLSFATAMPIWIKEKLFQKQLLSRSLRELDSEFETEKLLFSGHHQSHAASAFFPSPFEEAVVLTADGVGEWATTSVSIGRGNKLETIKEIHFPHSLGLLYSAFTYYLGFKVNSGEYKVMGLAPYGVARFKDIIFSELIDLKSDGSFRMNLHYFDYCTGSTMTNDRFARLFGHPVRDPMARLTQFHMDIAASVQAVIEEIMLRLTQALAKETALPNLCLAGGVALNCVANGKILRDEKFKNIWIQPAAGDAGGSVGAALAAYHQHLEMPRKLFKSSDSMCGSYLGPAYKQSEIEERLRAVGARFEVLDDAILISQAADALANSLIVGWFQGRMEFGPRALGNRSILADPRSADTQKNLNLRVKYRESFRPFAPSVLREDVDDWFEINDDSPYMLMVAGVHRKRCLDMTEAQKELFGIEKLNIIRSEIPAVTHVDYSARIQTVHKETNRRYHDLISAFKDRTGCPLVVNTSFNIRGEPIVCSPEDAFRCLMGTEIEILVVGNCFLRKDQQDPTLQTDYRDGFDLD